MSNQPPPIRNYRRSRQFSAALITLLIIAGVTCAMALVSVLGTTKAGPPSRTRYETPARPTQTIELGYYDKIGLHGAICEAIGGPLELDDDFPVVVRYYRQGQFQRYLLGAQFVKDGTTYRCTVSGRNIPTARTLAFGTVHDVFSVDELQR